MRETIFSLGVIAALFGGPLARADTSDTDLPPHGHAKSRHVAKPAALQPASTKPAAPLAPPVAPPGAAAPKVPMAPPPPPVLPPPTIVPLRPMPPPAPPIVAAGATGEATSTGNGLRVTFGPGDSDLNPATDAALRGLARDTPPLAATTFTIIAVAPGVPEDPSTPRRLSLSRALAVRGVLISEGVASNRIYVKALGASPLAIAGGPPDRVDVTVSSTPVSRQAPDLRQANTP